MRLRQHVRGGEWPPLVGVGLFVVLMAAGYYYNVTFVQLGLLGLGTRLVGLTRVETSLGMAGLALGAVAAAVAEHPVVSLTVGGTVATVTVALFVLMAFTIVLLPVTLLGGLAAVLVVAYGVLAYGYLLGSRLPVERRDLATAAGTVGVGLVLEVVPLVPLLGDLATLALLVAGVGAVLVTYFGVVRFEPPSLA